MGKYNKYPTKVELPNTPAYDKYLESTAKIPSNNRPCTIQVQDGFDPAKTYYAVNTQSRRNLGLV